MNRILLIDDNPEILLANESYLQKEGFHVTTADTGIKAIAMLHERQFDCILLDILLPDFDGFSICKAARTITDTPIIFLTCMDDVDDKIKGLMLGGDDYMTKPYSLKELSARIHALLRRAEKTVQPPNLDFYIDEQNRMLHSPMKNVFLSEKEFALFLLFYNHPLTVFSKEEIYELIWKKQTDDIGTVAVHILKLRRKIKVVEEFVGYIKNDYGRGYYFDPHDSEVTE